MCGRGIRGSCDSASMHSDGSILSGKSRQSGCARACDAAGEWIEHGAGVGMTVADLVLYNGASCEQRVRHSSARKREATPDEEVGERQG